MRNNSENHQETLPTWKNGLQDFQLDIVTPALDGIDGMLCNW
jgi:hypothetical protein